MHTQLGYLAFHEATHMVSQTIDGNGDYNKAAIVKQARDDPETARNLAQAYTLYAMEAGETCVLKCV